VSTMPDAARYHPDDALLHQFVTGTLPMGMNLAVSAHVDCCQPCQERTSATQDKASEDWFDTDFSPPAESLAEIFDAVVKQPARPFTEAEPDSKAMQTLNLHGFSVRLPRVLAKLVGQKLQWKEIASGIHQALLPVDLHTKCELIALDPGSEVPRHSHYGKELMLVLDGNITDDWDTYGPQDLVMREQEDCHGQISAQGCVCLFVTDAPLRFTEGFYRLLNPLNRLQHWWSQRQSQMS